MKLRLLTLATAAVLLAIGALAAPAAHAATAVVISQAAFGGAGGGNDEVIEIRNVSAATIAIGGWTLWGTNERRHRQRPRDGPGRDDAARGQDVRVRQLRGHVHRAGRRDYGTGYHEHGRHPDPQRRDGHGRVRRHSAPPAPTARARASPSRPTATAASPARTAARRTPTTTRRLRRPADADADEVRRDLPGPVGRRLRRRRGRHRPITSIQTLGASAACNGTTVKLRGIVTGIDNLYGSTLRRDLQGRLRHLDPGGRPATRRATTSSALFVAGIRRDAANPAGVIGSRHHDHAAASRPSSARSASSRRASATRSSPAAQEVDLGERRHDQLDRQRAAGARRARPRRRPRRRTVDRPYYRSLQGMRVPPARGHRDRRRHDQVP